MALASNTSSIFYSVDYFLDPINDFLLSKAGLLHCLTGSSEYKMGLISFADSQFIVQSFLANRLKSFLCPGEMQIQEFVIFDIMSQNGENWGSNMSLLAAVRRCEADHWGLIL